MEALIQKKPNTVMRVIDIKRWTSEVARQHGVNRIPQIWLYDGTQLVTKDPNQVFEFLSR